MRFVVGVRFDASGDALTRTTNLPSSSAFTFMGWFRIVNDRNNFSAFMSFDDNNSGVFNDYTMETIADGTTVGLWNGTSTISGSALTVGTWYHLAMTVNGTSGSNFLGYVNGVLDITHTAHAGASTKLWVGNDDSTEWLDGRVGPVKIYDAVLTAAEIKAEMWQYVPARWANLNSWFPNLNNGEAGSDYAGAVRNMTTGGTLTTEEGPPIPWRRRRHRRSTDTAPAVLEQEGYRFRNDDGSEAAATWKAAQDTPITAPADVNTRVRILVNATGEPPDTQYQLEYRVNGGAWRKVPIAP